MSVDRRKFSHTAAGATILMLAPQVALAQAHPDFSGIWGNPYLYGIEPPLSGPGPVVNQARRGQTLDVAGRPWTIVYYTRPVVELGSDRLGPAFFIGGLIATLLVAAATWSQEV